VAGNPPTTQAPGRRKPRQARSLYKIELIFEAAQRLIEEGGVDKLTTNAIAETAGVSIGTLYQYFGDKHALLEALVVREMQRLSDSVRERILEEPPRRRGDRVRALVAIVLDTYGGRRRAHSALMPYAMNQGRPSQLGPLFAEVAQSLAGDHLVDADRKPVTMTPAQAYVLASALFGVLRNLAATPDLPHAQEEIEDALVRLVLGFIDMPS
jgi:AcrR family transcriptional regulator